MNHAEDDLTPLPDLALPGGLSRRRLGLAGLGGLAAGALGLAPQVLRAQPGDGDGGRKVLRLAFTKAETSFDPARIVDLYSRVVTAHLFEALYSYDHLARPAKIKPVTADGMPEV